MARAVVLGDGQFQVDHNGLDTGARITRIDEAYRVTVAAGATTDPMTALPYMRFLRTGTQFNYEIGDVTPGALTGGSNALKIYTGATNASGDYGYVGQDGAVFNAGTMAGVAVLEFEVAPSAVGANSIDIWCGWTNTRAIHLSTACAAFKLPSGASSAWNIVTAAGGVSTTTATTVAGSTSAWHRMRVEVHSAGTALGAFAGAVAVFFIDNTFVGYHTTNVPAVTLLPSFGMLTTGASVNRNVVFSAYSARATRHQAVEM
jgi:hypothetical protein